MRGGMQTLPLSILQDLLGHGRLGAVDLASLEASSSMFRVLSGMECSGVKLSIAEAAAHHSCEMHPVFENLPPPARSELLARCEGSWKLVLHFLESLQRSSGRSPSGNASSTVLTAAGQNRTLIVNEKGEVYECGEYAPEETFENPELIPFPATARRIVQVSANFDHAAFVSETGQVFAYGMNDSNCCGVAVWPPSERESMLLIQKPTLVTALERIPCQQVTTGEGFTLAITRQGELYSWGGSYSGALGQGHIEAVFRPQPIEQFDGSDPVVQVSAGRSHTLAVTKSGQLFTWGVISDYRCDLWRYEHDDVIYQQPCPKRVEGLDGLFIASAAAGYHHSAAIDSSGHVYTWGQGHLAALGHGDREDQSTPLLVACLKDTRAIQVVAKITTFVLLDNGTVHYFGVMVTPPETYQCRIGWANTLEDNRLIPPEDWSDAGSYVMKGHNVHSIDCGEAHAVLVTKKGAILGFGYNDEYQLGELVDVAGTETSSEAEGPTLVLGTPTGSSKVEHMEIPTPVQVFHAITGFERPAEVSDKSHKCDHPASS